LTAVGATERVVQLVDVALRLSVKAYDFLCAVKDARKNIVQLALQVVESTLRILRYYIAKFNRPNNATEEYKVLLEAVTAAINDFRSDLDLLKTILP
ncbi:hypothetical protein K432DRAFT_272265, partial [Lepidopterella palustris CBS 459.81]